MAISTIDRIRDPLTDRFDLDELPRVAPWVYDEITSIGVNEVRDTIADMGEDPTESLLMRTWVEALTQHRSKIWRALAQA
ncbi:hypothetical protein [Devosia sp. 1566]|uniref:hypothetical protein n=1 Tax=Devosia sp. 1566 TaxID=2499144 RepID=UPI000FDCB8C3|nr:hypothetical protein [Devosia sp. 1566]